MRSSQNVFTQQMYFRAAQKLAACFFKTNQRKLSEKKRILFTQRGTASFSRHSPAGVVGSLRRGGGVELFETADLKSGGVHHGTRTF